ncbi:hypothetical protein [Gracilinema caldarium]|uniref:hypothetical protein n=1 Tax=Gracilinema caldarium TaxID=215591 RepID=UPI0026EAFA9E|nr:hypothetical protein [Gracilinema caldarium]
MFDPKISALVAGIAFILSFLFGLLAGASFLIVLLRAVIFAIFFFVFSGLVYWLITQFIPELLESQGSSSEGVQAEVPDLGAKVNISVGEEEPVPENTLSAQLMKEGLEEDEFISEKALDQKDEDGYTEQKEVTARTESTVESSPSPAIPLGVIDDVDELPDLERMSDAFVMPLSEGSEVDEPSTVADISTPARKTGSSAAFDPKEMAMAIQTILKRDQKG